MMKCKICGTEISACFTGKILDKYNINYYHCANCDFVQTEDPYWLEEAYARSINLSDTGYMVRNLSCAKRLKILLYLLFGKSGQFLDYAGGYGVFVRLMRDIGFDFSWDDKYTQNLFAVGFEWDRESPVDAVTLFEVFEHYVDPMSEVENLLKITDTIIFSTKLHPNPLPAPRDWWYYGVEHGQHIAFYSKATLHFMAKKFGLNYCNIGSLHVFSKKNVSKLTLFATRLSKFGLDKVVSRRITSKTWSDHELMSKVGNNENSL